MRARNFVEILSDKHKYAVPVLLLVITFMTYFQITGHDFISYDDPAYITENVHVMNGLNYNSIKWAFTSVGISYWHPMTWISHMVDYQIYGSNPFGHHMTNIIIHTLNTLLLFYLLYYSTKQYWKSLFVAAVFALHPLHVESVAWAAERKDLLSTFFMMLTLLFYSASVINKNRRFYVLTILFYILGLMSKPMLVSLPLVLILWDYWPLDRYSTHDVRTVDLIREKLPFFFLALLTSLITYYAQLKVGAVMGIDSAPFFLRILNALSSYMNYIYKMFWPQHLAVIYPLTHNISVIQGIISGLLLLGISTIVYRYRKSHHYLTTGWVWYLITLLPVIGIVQVGSQSMANRYTYTTQIGLYIMIAWSIANLLEKYQYKYLISSFAGIIVISALTVSTWIQLTYWMDSITLFNHAAHCVDNNYIAYRMLGDNYGKIGNVQAAIASFTEAIKIEPNDSKAHEGLGVALIEQKRYEEAMYHLSTAIALNPQNDNAYYNLGVVLAYNHRYEDAIYSYMQSLRINPEKKGARANIGAALFHLGKFDEAIHYFQEELKIDPGNEAIKNYIGAAINIKNAAK
ncbi:MAG TPA: tetratricopeptide repeat protein [Nitrospirota bacterium]|nr:tetratricopeptide repeat protein [Nitrospirota bacterium]